MRVFVSIGLPSVAVDAILPTLKSLAEAEITGMRPVPASAAHITVRFLGEVPVGKVGAVGEALDGAVRSFGRFSLELSGVGSFPPNRPPTVVWVGVGGDVATATALRATVDKSLASIVPGIAQESFMPHVTLVRLGRRVSGSEKRRALKVAQACPPRKVSFDVGAINLVHSQLGPDGASHVTLGEFGLCVSDGDA